MPISEKLASNTVKQRGMSMHEERYCNMKASKEEGVLLEVICRNAFIFYNNKQHLCRQ
jgi:hypothetical protein